MAPASRDLAGVELLEQFADVRLLHSGSRFTVYEAREPVTRRAVVVKTPDAAAPSWLGEVLDHQATILAAISAHPHIVTLYQRLTLSDGRPALVFEHCTDPISRALGDGGRMPAHEAVSIGIKLAGALETAHDADTIHCDVRPGNVLRSEWGEPMLAGFDEAVRIGGGLRRTSGRTDHDPAHGARTAAGRASDARHRRLRPGGDALRAGRRPQRVPRLRRRVPGSDHRPGARADTVRPIVDPAIPLALSDLLTWALDGNPSRRPPSPAWLAEELARLEIEQGWSRTRMISP